jgi:mannose-1-phosphate guanylyltransferase
MQTENSDQHDESSATDQGMPGFWAVIPAGGSGTRLWPLSRSARPKFLLPLLGRRSLLQETVHRLRPLAPPERTFVVCGPAHAAPVARQLPGLPESHILVEPSPKGSGPAIALAAAIIERFDPDAVMGSFAADHEVAFEDAFIAAVATGIAAARDGWLVAIGLSPTRPETGYGYIQRTSEEVSRSRTGVAYRAAGFSEKPDQATAEQYLAAGNYLWNASMFVWTPRTLMEELERLQPDLATGVRAIAHAWGTPEQDTVAAEIWATIEESTIDEGVMEKSQRIAVVPADLGWSDVGDWHGLGELIAADTDGNAVRGDVIQSGTRNSVIWSETGRLIALVGLENIAVVDTEDALLVINRDSAQEVRRIVEQLKQMRRTSYQ